MDRPIATWSAEFDCWVVAPDSDQGSLFSVQPVVLSETFPNSGMTRGTSLFAPPTSAAVTAGLESFSSLPTPRATRGGSASETTELLPTPEAKLGSSGPDYAKALRPASGGDDLQTAVARSLTSPPHAPPTAPRAAPTSEDPPAT